MRQQLLCHVIILSGYSHQFVNLPLMDFFSSRDARYENIHTSDHLQRTQIEKVYNKDLAAFCELVRRSFVFLITDETPTAHNVPLLNVVARLVDVVSSIPNVSTALVSSKEIRGRCDAAEVVRQLETAADLMGLDANTRHRILGVATDSAAYDLKAVDDIQTSWEAFLMKVRCPSHLIHLVVEFIANLTDEDLNIILDGTFRSRTGFKSLLDSITSIIEMRDLRKLYGIVPPIP